jgi:urate oxidase
LRKSTIRHQIKKISSANNNMPLIRQQYGKDKVRLVKTSVLPADSNAPHLKHQHISELTCCVLLSGPLFDASYSKADNSLVVPTDTGKYLISIFLLACFYFHALVLCKFIEYFDFKTVKNTIYYLAKKSPETLETIELFAHTIATHFLATYKHVEGVDISIQSHNWTRLTTTTMSPVTDDYAGTAVTGRGSGLYTPTSATPVSPHPHSFYRGGEERRITKIFAQRISGTNDMKITGKSGLVDLLVLKTTGSSFENFHRCSLTTLPDMSDRVFSTSVECYWSFPAYKELIPSSAVFDHSKATSGFSAVRFDAIFRGVKQITIDIFANHNSPSVQNSLYRMGEHVLECFPDIHEISYALPNKHVFGYDLDRFGLENKGKNMSVYYPVNDPSGLITATIGRGNHSKL